MMNGTSESEEEFAAEFTEETEETEETEDTPLTSEVTVAHPDNFAPDPVFKFPDPGIMLESDLIWLIIPNENVWNDAWYFPDTS